MTEAETPNPRPRTLLDRPSARTEAEREAVYQRYVRVSEPYFTKVRDNGDQPWFTTDDERRELFMRRYTRPAPPAGLTVPTIERHAA